MGPISTGLGEIYLWTVEAKDGAQKPDGSPYTATDLREIQDWIIKPQLRNVPGVTEINSIGGYAKQYQVAPIPEKLASYGLTLQDVVTALDRNNDNVGAGYIEKRGEQYLIRAPGQVHSIEDIGNVILGNAKACRSASATWRSRHRPRAAHRCRHRKRPRSGARHGVHADRREQPHRLAGGRQKDGGDQPHPARRRTRDDRLRPDGAGRQSHRHGQEEPAEGAVLVIVILFLFLGNIRAAIITAMVIPLAMLFTFTGMVTYKVSANLMSLGALDFGIIIDGAVVIVENCVRRLAHAQAQQGRPLTRSERFHEVFTASQEARRPLLFGQLIIMVVYLPIFALTGVEGKMFHPMAFTVVAALVGAMILSVTFIPAAVALFIGDKVAEKENRADADGPSVSMRRCWIASWVTSRWY